MKKDNNDLFNFPSGEGSKKERVSFKKGGVVRKIAMKAKDTILGAKENLREIVQDKRHRHAEKKASKKAIKKIGSRAKDFVPLGQTDEIPEMVRRPKKKAKGALNRASKSYQKKKK